MSFWFRQRLLQVIVRRNIAPVTKKRITILELAEHTAAVAEHESQIRDTQQVT